MYEARWGIFVTGEAIKRNAPAFAWSRSQIPPMSYAIDNGAWSAYTADRDWDPAPFIKTLIEHGSESDFVVVPDIVAGGAASLDRSLEWLDRVLEHAPTALIAVQDGMKPSDIEHLLSSRIGVFVGGSTEWKIATLNEWARAARAAGAWCHVGRVNTVGRMNRCSTAGVTSIDGTSVTRFACTLPKLDGARRQMSLGVDP
tara:strand:- start:1089 stop:1688 length:600 start_codon:yes stop_codon:yes gene_type:complete